VKKFRQVGLEGHVPRLRLQPGNDAPINTKGDYILYWMIAYRRVGWNLSLDRAVEWAQELKKPLVILEPLRCGYRWASERFHRFVLDGMGDNARRLADTPALYYPYVEPTPGAGKGLLAALAKSACVVVTDDFPCFFLPLMVAAAARRLPVRLERVDSNGIFPLRAAGRVFSTAHSFRRFVQMNLLAHLSHRPRQAPLAGARLPRLNGLPARVVRRWPRASAELLGGDPRALAELPIDHTVGVVDERGGTSAAQAAWRRFLREGLARYIEDRTRVDAQATSGLSPYLHFGHISAHQIVHELLRHEDWAPRKLGAHVRGSRSGWWGVSQEAEAFLDQLITWRELGFNFCCQRDDYDRYQSLPEWARNTLAEHAKDPRPYCYTLRKFERAETHDELWNTAQRQLVREGRVHNYLRMFWGKKILEWSRSPRRALEIMIELNNKYALDGRDPNSYSGVFWCLGRYDRPWGPERPMFGTVRYMSSKNTARKVGRLPACATLPAPRL
jgi:deoxyribodipyrimidine photo-lyase